MDTNNSSLPSPPSSPSARPQDEHPPAPKRFKSEESAPGDADAKHAGCPDDGTSDKQSGGDQPAIAGSGLPAASVEQSRSGDAPPVGPGQPSSFAGKRKQGEPTKLSPGQQGGLSLPQRPACPGAVVPPSASAAGGQESHSDDGSESSSSLDEGDQTALLAALLQGGLQGEHAEFIRAYLARHTDLLEEVSAVMCSSSISFSFSTKNQPGSPEKEHSQAADFPRNGRLHKLGKKINASIWVERWRQASYLLHDSGHVPVDSSPSWSWHFRELRHTGLPIC